MKLWEVIKELTEDPKKKFERKDRYKHWVIGTDVVGGAISGETYYFMLDCYGEDSYGDAGKFSGNLANNEDDWQPVRQPVPWQEAVQAWGEGRKIRIKNRRGGESFYSGGVGGLINLTHDELVHGTWYVED